ncbi:EAL domain-containing protein [Stutzerimonas urumqiensis]|uniref:bifunctional diguanylate cyclase/phosphodiesterase n=1 Tax=Stutzerimonas urumqiensis TaxID=638269 RepID=UPI003BABF5CE
MSLFKQLLIAICLFLLTAFAGSFVIGLEASRGQYANQLRSHAQDAATALGLSLTANIDDPAMVELVVSSLFDSGYYQSIRVTDLATDTPVVVRESQPDAGSAPQWFVDLIALQAETGDALVSRGWQQVAQVEVVSHPMFAVARLWQSTLGMLGWLLLCGLVSAVLGAWMLRRQLRPLDDMVEQSRAITRREFFSVTRLPETPELRRVVLAMNLMVDKLKGLFDEEARRSERLREEAYHDALTGLSNRRHFDLQLRARLGGEDQAGSGYMVLLRVHDLAGLNQRLGGRQSDELLRAVARQLRQVAGDQVLIGRTRGGEFAVLAAGLDRPDAQRLAENLDQALATLHTTGLSDRSPVAHLALAPFGPECNPAALYAALDETLAQASSQARRSWAFHDAAAMPVAEQRRDWHLLLDDVLNKDLLQLHCQPVVSAAEPCRVIHHKVLARLVDEQGVLLPAARFLPWLERFGWAARLDLAILRQALAQLQEHHTPLAVSLCGSTLRNADTCEQVFDLLGQHVNVAGLLTLELDEGQLPDQATLERLARRLRVLGFGLGVQHFGGRFSLIGNLARLGLGYLKVDGAYIRGLDQEDDKRLFIEAVQRAAHSIDLPLIAEQVETEGEWLTLRELGFEGGQGRLLGDPAPWHEVGSDQTGVVIVD